MEEFATRLEAALERAAKRADVHGPITPHVLRFAYTQAHHGYDPGGRDLRRQRGLRLRSLRRQLGRAL